jgi:hypothetical protein
MTENRIFILELKLYRRIQWLNIKVFICSGLTRTNEGSYLRIEYSYKVSVPNFFSGVWFKVLNSIFNNISVISCWSVYNGRGNWSTWDSIIKYNVE